MSCLCVVAGVKDHRGAGASPADTHDIQVRDPGAGRNNVTGAGSERSVRRTGMFRTCVGVAIARKRWACRVQSRTIFYIGPTTGIIPVSLLVLQYLVVQYEFNAFIIKKKYMCVGARCVSGPVRACALSAVEICNKEEIRADH